MRSSLVENCDSRNQSRYSDLMVLKSQAGYYVGTLYQHPEGFEEPGSRDSGYFSTEEEAVRMLDYMKEGGTEGVRYEP